MRLFRKVKQFFSGYGAPHGAPHRPDKVKRGAPHGAPHKKDYHKRALFRVRISPLVIQDFKAACKERGLTASGVVEVMLRRALLEKEMKRLEKSVLEERERHG